MCTCDEHPEPVPVPTEAEMARAEQFWTRTPDPLTDAERADYEARLTAAFGAPPAPVVPPEPPSGVWEEPDGA